jgi:hypothetical protein
MAQAINLTSGQAPGSTSVGGIMQMKSLSQLQSEERAAAQAANNDSVVQGFAGHIKKLWWDARQAKEMTAEIKMLQSVRQRRGEYDPDMLAQLAEQNSTTIYMMLTSNKCRAAASWIRDVLLNSTDDKPWTLEAPPVADMPPQLIEEIMQIAQQQLAAAMQQGQNPSDFEVRQMLMALKDIGLAQIQDMAQQDADRMERKMQTQLLGGGWLRALAEFIDDITTFPSAFMKGPVVRKRPKLKWVQGPGGWAPDVQQELSLEWERVDPFMMYPAPDASNVEDSWLIERHKLQRADLNALIGVEGYSDQAIRAVLDAYGKGGLREWLYVDTAKATAEGKATIGVATNPSELIDALQFWGSVQGQMLIDWGMDETEIQDPLAEYPIEAWLIGSWVIKAAINPDPLGRKPYYKASYEEVPGAFWGNSVADLCRDTQGICNAAARALVNNMGLASGPQVVYNVDRLPEGEKLTQIYPWKIWQVTSDPLSNSSQPPMQFFQPQSMSQELMMVYNQFSALADEYTGIPRYMTGDSPSGGAGRTASGMSMLMGNAGKSIKQVIGNIDDRVIEQAIDRLYYYNMRYSSDSDLKGAVNVVARGAVALMQKDAAQQKQSQFLQVALGNQMVQDVVGKEGIAELIRNAAKTLDMDAGIVAPLPVLKQRWAQEQQAAAAQQQKMQQQQFAQAFMIKHGVMLPGQAPLVPQELQEIMTGRPSQVPLLPGAPPAPQGQQGQGAPGPRPGPGAQLSSGAPVTNNFGASRGG